GMVLAAKLGALPVIESLTLGTEPGFVDASRNGVDLDTEGWHRERMDHIAGGHQEAHRRIDGKNHFIVDSEETRISCLVLLACGFAVIFLKHKGAERDTSLVLGFVLVLVVPVPLHAGRLDGHLRLFIW